MLQYLAKLIRGKRVAPVPVPSDDQPASTIERAVPEAVSTANRGGWNMSMSNSGCFINQPSWATAPANSAPTIGSFTIGTDDKALVRKVLDEDPSVLRGLMDTTNAGLFHVPVSPQRVIQTIEGVRAMGIPLDGLDALFTELVGDVLHDTVSENDDEQSAPTLTKPRARL